MPRVNGGQALMRSIARMGVDIVFGVPGWGQYEAVDALYDLPAVRYISTRHEQETTFMADAYTQISGRPAVAMVVPGPGLLYASAGLASAYANSSPVLVVTGDNPDSDLNRRQLELGALRSMTKWTGQVDQPGQIPEAVAEAFHHLRSGRPRPVGLIVPAAVLAATTDVRLPDPPAQEAPSCPNVEEAVSWLRQSRRPLLWVGSGVFRSGAEEAVRRLADDHGIPTVSSRRGKGIVGDSHPLGLGTAERRLAPLRKWIESRDLVLAVGVGGEFQSFKNRVIQIDADEELNQRGGPRILQLRGDALATLEELRPRLKGVSFAPDGKEAEKIAELKSIRLAPESPLQPQWDLIQAMREAAPPETIFIQGMNQMGYYSRNYLRLDPPGRLLTSSTQITLGAAYLLSLGARLADPTRPVVAISGDGGFGYSSGAMATAVQHGIGSTVVVFNDNAYGNVLRAQKEEFDMRVIGTRLRNPDFVALADAYGANAWRAEDASELCKALRTALAADRHGLIEVPVGEMQRVF